MTGFNAAIDAMMATLRQVKGEKGTYARGASSVVVVVVPARTDVDLESDDGVLTRLTSDDFLIEVASLVIDGQKAKPQMGDRLTIDDATYELMEIPPGGCWNYSGQTRTHYRIHTRLT